MSLLSQRRPVHRNQRQPRNAVPRRRPGLVLVIVCAGVVLASLDLFIVNVALPADRPRPAASRAWATLSWVLNGYAIVYAALLVFFGRLADRHRRRPASCSAWPSSPRRRRPARAAASVPHADRLPAGAGGRRGPADARPRSAWCSPPTRPSAAAARCGPGPRSAAWPRRSGPVVGGLLVAASWRWVFLVNVPIGVAALVVGWRRLPDVPGHPVPRPDALGAVLVTAGVGALTFGLVAGRRLGLGARPAPSASLAAAVVLLGLVRRCTACASNPLIEPGAVPGRAPSPAPRWRCCCSRPRSARCCCRSCCGSRTSGAGRRCETGLAIAPGPLMVPVFSFLVAGRLIRRFGPAVVIGARPRRLRRRRGLVGARGPAAARLRRTGAAAGCCSPASASGSPCRR